MRVLHACMHVNACGLLPSSVHASVHALKGLFALCAFVCLSKDNFIRLTKQIDKRYTGRDAECIGISRKYKKIRGVHCMFAYVDKTI